MKRENFLEILDRKGKVKFLYSDGTRCYYLWAETSDSVRASGQGYIKLLKLGERPLVYIILLGDIYKAHITASGIVMPVWVLGNQFTVFMPWKDIGV